LAKSLLTAFWIVPPFPRRPLGFGVTAFSLKDALQIIQDEGFELPDDLSTLEIRENIKYDELESSYVQKHMGPIVVRGMWYPFHGVGTIRLR
jgi:hypothetical protein